MYIIDFLKCMDPKLLIRNKKAANIAFMTIIVFVIALAILIWFIFFTGRMAEKGKKGVDLIKDAVKSGGAEP